MSYLKYIFVTHIFNVNLVLFESSRVSAWENEVLLYLQNKYFTVYAVTGQNSQYNLTNFAFGLLYVQQFVAYTESANQGAN